MGPLFYMRSAVNRIVVMRCMTVHNLKNKTFIDVIYVLNFSRPQFHLSLLGSFASLQTQRHVVAKVGTSKRRGKQWQTTTKNLPRMQCAKSHIGSTTGLWFLPDRLLRLNINE